MHSQIENFDPYTTLPWSSWVKTMKGLWVEWRWAGFESYPLDTYCEFVPNKQSELGYNYKLRGRITINKGSVSLGYRSSPTAMDFKIVWEHEYSNFEVAYNKVVDRIGSPRYYEEVIN